MSLHFVNRTGFARIRLTDMENGTFYVSYQLITFTLACYSVESLQGHTLVSVTCTTVFQLSWSTTTPTLADRLHVCITMLWTNGFCKTWYCQNLLYCTVYDSGTY
jgi:hypothetical protein